MGRKESNKIKTTKYCNFVKAYTRPLCVAVSVASRISILTSMVGSLNPGPAQDFS